MMATLGELERTQFKRGYHQNIYLHMKSGDVYELADESVEPYTLLTSMHVEPLIVKHTDGTTGTVYLAPHSIESVEVAE